MMSSRGMGAINPSKMPKAKVKKRRDNTDFEVFKKGGKITAANYDKEYGKIYRKAVKAKKAKAK